MGIAAGLFSASKEAFGQTAQLTPGTIYLSVGNTTVGRTAAGTATTSTTWNSPRGMTMDTLGNIWVATGSSNSIRKFTISTGVVSTVAGGGVSECAFTGSVTPATSCSFASSVGVAIDSRGLIYEVEATNPIVRVINLTGSSITVGPATYANNTETAFAGNGTTTGNAITTTPQTATNVAFGATPNGIAIDASNNIYISDTSNNKIDIITNSSCINTGTGCQISVFAGSGTLASSNGTGTAASFNGPRSLSVDASGTNLYVVEYGGGHVRKITLPGAVVTTLAGGQTTTGNTCSGYTDTYGDGCQATLATMTGTRGVHLDAAGNLYIADGNDTLMRFVNTSGVISTLVGGGTVCSGHTDTMGDGCLANQTTLGAIPMDILPDSNGNYYVLDYGNNLLRVVVTNLSAIAFSNTAVGASSAVSSVLLTNTGATTLTLTGVAVTSGASNFTLATGGSYCNYSTALTAGQSCLVGVIFNPSTTGALTGTVTITDNATGGTTQTVNLSGTGTTGSLLTPTVTLGISPTTVITSQSVTFTATVTHSGTAPTGTVYFVSGGTTLGSGIITSGTATFTTTTIPAGSYSVTANYSGDTNYAATDSSATSLTVNVGKASSTAFTALPSNATYGSTITLTATVTGSGGTPTGTVTFYNGLATVGTQTLTSGVAMLTTTALPVGANSLTASYSGDGSFVASTSSAATVTIGTLPAVAISPAVISTFAGTGTPGYSGDNGPASSAEIYTAYYVDRDSSGNMYISDTATNTIRKVTPGGTITTIAGTPNTPGYSGDSGLATAAKLDQPRGVGFDPAGNMYIDDSLNNVIRKVDTSGNITTYAGVQQTTGSHSGVPGPATSAHLNTLRGIAVDGSGNVFISEYSSYCVDMVPAASGTHYGISMTAGNIYAILGTCGAGGDTTTSGPSTSTVISNPYQLNFDAFGNLYVVDYGDSIVRKVSPTGTASIVAGTPGVTGYTGDGGAATSAKLQNPRGVAVDSGGDIFIVDTGNYVIRKVDSTGVINTIAGIHTLGNSGDGGSALAAQFNLPYGVGLDLSGNVYLADEAESRIRKLTVSSGILVFPAQAQSTTSAAQTLTVYNAGGQTLTFTGLSVSGSSAFTKVASGGNDCTSSEVLAPGGICLIAFTFTPTSFGQVTGMVTLTNNSGGVAGTTQTISLIGTGLGSYPVPTTAISAPSTTTYGASISITVTVTGTGPTPTGTVLLTASPFGGSTATLASAGALSGGSYTYTGTLPQGTLPPGTDNILAVYSGDSIYNGSTSAVATVTLTQGTQTISFSPSLSYVVGSGNVTLSATATSGLAVTFTKDASSTATCSVSGSTLTISSTGNCVIDANQAGNTFYSAATQVQATIVSKSSQTITGFAPPSSYTDGSGTVTLSATASSGLTVVFTSDASSTATCSVSGTTLTISGSGICVIDANQSGSSTYWAATQVQATINVSASLLTPTLTASAPSSTTYGNSVSVTATISGTGATPTGTVTITATPSGGSAILLVNAATLVGGSYTYTGTLPAGTDAITVSYSGDSTYASGFNSTAATVTVGKATPAAISWSPLTTSQIYGPPLGSNVLNAVAPGSPAGSITYTATPAGGNASSITAASVLPVVTGGYILTATFTPTDTTDYNTVTAFSSYSVTQATQTISFTAPTTPVTYGVSPIALVATGGASGNAVSFSVLSGPGTITGGTNLTVTGAGSIVVAADQAGNTNYSAATEVTHTVVVNQATQTITGITFNPPSPVNFGVGPITISVTGSGASGNSVTYSVVSGPGTITGGTNLTVTGVGTIVVAADQAGNSNYLAATEVTASMVVNKGSQTITFTQPGTPVALGVSPIALSASSTSGLTVSFSVLSGPGTITGGTNLTVTGVGTIVVAADQAGNSNYNAATEVQRSVTVNAASSSTSLSTSLTSVVPGQPVTLTATVSGSVGTPTGTVTFSAASTGATSGVLGTGTLVNGVATYYGLIWGGTDTVTATYNGDSNYGGSTSSAVTVSNYPSTGKLQFNWPFVNWGQAVSYGASSGSWPVSVQNLTGVTVNTPTVTSSSANFVVTAGTCNGTGTLAVGASCSFSVVFTPTTGGSPNGTLVTGTLTASTTTSSSYSNTITISGTAVSSSLTFNWPFLNFTPSVSVGSTSSAWPVIMTNQSGTSTTVNSIGFSDASFAVTGDTCTGTTLGAGGTCTFSVVFSPISADITQSGTNVISGTMTVSGNSGAVSGSLAVGGWAAAALGFNWPFVTFQSVVQGATGSNPWPVTVTNYSGQTLSGMTYTLTGVSNYVSGAFTLTNTCSSLAPGASCTFDIVPTPQSGQTSGAYSATLVVSGSGLSSPSLSVSGSTIAGGYSINWNQDQQAGVSTIDFGPQNAAGVQAGPWPITVYNNTPSVETVSLTPSLGQFTTDVSTLSNIPSGGSASFNLYFTPTVDTSYQGTLTIAGGGFTCVINTWGGANK
jgi:hypothetical protein